MCRRVRTIWLTLPLMAIAASKGHGQTAAEFAERYARLVRATTRIKDSVAVLRHQSLARVVVDTIQSGALTVLVRRADAGRIRPAVDRAWRILSRTFGAQAELLRGRPTLVWSVDYEEAGRLAQELQVTAVPVPIVADTGIVVDRIVAWASPIPYSKAGAVLSWLARPPSLSMVRSPSIPLYEELATAPWSTARACFDGDLEQCARGLGITNEDPVTRWFDARDRQQYVTQYLPRMTSRQRKDQCILDGDDVACIALMRASPATPAPASISARQLLLALALDHGGPEAFDRLVAASDQPLDARLALAALLPRDSLLSRWRSHILAAHPKTVAADSRAGWSAVFWGVLFGLVALRSARWR